MKPGLDQNGAPGAERSIEATGKCTQYSARMRNDLVHPGYASESDHHALGCKAKFVQKFTRSDKIFRISPFREF
jgi:hypothetical protein